MLGSDRQKRNSDAEKEGGDTKILLSKLEEKKKLTVGESLHESKQSRILQVLENNSERYGGHRAVHRRTHGE